MMTILMRWEDQQDQDNKKGQYKLLYEENI